jgi:hypothetical protein
MLQFSVLRVQERSFDLPGCDLAGCSLHGMASAFLNETRSMCLTSPESLLVSATNPGSSAIETAQIRVE